VVSFARIVARQRSTENEQCSLNGLELAAGLSQQTVARRRHPLARSDWGDAPMVTVRTTRRGSFRDREAGRAVCGQQSRAISVRPASCLKALSATLTSGSFIESRVSAAPMYSRYCSHRCLEASNAGIMPPVSLQNGKSPAAITFGRGCRKPRSAARLPSGGRVPSPGRSLALDFLRS